ncbi:MAG: hypothetical protein ACLFUX_01615 [Spirochaetaceae bacterium]
MNVQRTAIRLLIAVFLWTSPAVAAVSSQVEELLDRGSFDAEARSRIEAVFEQAEAEKVPESFLVPRLAEGIAKDVSTDRLVEALEGRLAALVEAGETLLEGEIEPTAEDNAGLWNRAGLLLWDGAPAGHLRRLVRATSGRPEALERALPLYVSMEEWGLSQSEAADIAEGVLRSSIPPEDYPGILEVLAEARSERIRIPTIVTRLIEELPSADSMTGLREAVLF